MRHRFLMIKRINRFMSGLEWRWSLGAAIWGVFFPTTSFVLPAWGARASGVFSEYSPLSWVVAGFAGLFIYALCVALYGFGQSRSVRSKYDARFMAETGGVDPLSKVFEGKRIFLNDFILPSNPFVNGKTFVDCEIVGPANMFLAMGNAINDIRPGLVDAVVLSGDRQFHNGFNFFNCTFRGCTFHRVTLFFTAQEYVINAGVDWLNWISPIPAQRQLELGQTSQIEDLSHLSSEDTAEDKLH